MFTMESALLHLRDIQAWTHPSGPDDRWDVYRQIIPYRLVRFDARLGSNHGVGLLVTEVSATYLLFQVLHAPTRTVFAFKLLRDGTDDIQHLSSRVSTVRDTIVHV